MLKHIAVVNLGVMMPSKTFAVKKQRKFLIRDLMTKVPTEKTTRQENGFAIRNN